MYKVIVEIEGETHERETEHVKYVDVAAEMDMVWCYYQQKCWSENHPPVTVRIKDTEKKISFMPRYAR